MTDRGRDRYADASGHLRDMTEETLGAQEQERQERQHRRERLQQRQQERDHRTDVKASGREQGDDDQL
jgi:hypothetical protein